MMSSNIEAGAPAESPVEIRDCRVEDFDPVLKLLGQLWPDARMDPGAMRKVFHRVLQSDNCYALCAIASGGVVGFCDFNVRDSLWQQGKLAYVDELVVDEGMRRRGIGADLLERAAQVAERLGCSRIELDSAFHRSEARRFYDSQGWGRRATLFGKDLG